MTHTPGPWDSCSVCRECEHGLWDCPKHGRPYIEHEQMMLRLHKAAPDLLEAAEAALCHIVELESAWQRGIINEPPSAGGTRSNRNVDVRVSLRAAIAKARGGQS